MGNSHSHNSDEKLHRSGVNDASNSGSTGKSRRNSRVREKVFGRFGHKKSKDHHHHHGIDNFESSSKNIKIAKQKNDDVEEEKIRNEEISPQLSSPLSADLEWNLGEEYDKIFKRQESADTDTARDVLLLDESPFTGDDGQKNIRHHEQQINISKTSTIAAAAAARKTNPDNEDDITGYSKISVLDDSKSQINSTIKNDKIINMKKDFNDKQFELCHHHKTIKKINNLNENVIIGTTMTATVKQQQQQSTNKISTTTESKRNENNNNEALTFLPVVVDDVAAAVAEEKEFKKSNDNVVKTTTPLRTKATSIIEAITITAAASTSEQQQYQPQQIVLERNKNIVTKQTEDQQSMMVELSGNNTTNTTLEKNEFMEIKNYNRYNNNCSNSSCGKQEEIIIISNNNDHSTNNNMKELYDVVGDNELNKQEINSPTFSTNLNFDQTRTSSVLSSSSSNELKFKKVSVNESVIKYLLEENQLIDDERSPPLPLNNLSNDKKKSKIILVQTDSWKTAKNLHTLTIDRLSDHDDLDNCEVIILKERKSSTSSDSIFTDPLTPIGFAAELNECYYSEENILDTTTDEISLKKLANRVNAAADEIISSRNYLNLKKFNNYTRIEEILNKLTISETIYLNLIETTPPNDSPEDDLEMAINLRNKLAQMLNSSEEQQQQQQQQLHQLHQQQQQQGSRSQLAASSSSSLESNAGIFNVSKAKKIELQNLSSRIADNNLTTSGTSTGSKIQSSNSSNVTTPTQEMLPCQNVGSVLKRVASYITAEKSGTTTPTDCTNKIIIEKSSFSECEKFEGQMLIKWFSNSIVTKNFPINEQDLNKIIEQYCTNLLWIGVIKPIADELNKYDLENFNPYQMYQWAHREISPRFSQNTKSNELRSNSSTKKLQLDLENNFDGYSNNNDGTESDRKVYELKKSVLNCNNLTELYEVIETLMPDRKPSCEIVLPIYPNTSNLDVSVSTECDFNENNNKNDIGIQIKNCCDLAKNDSNRTKKSQLVVVQSKETQTDEISSEKSLQSCVSVPPPPPPPPPAAISLQSDVQLSGPPPPPAPPPPPLLLPLIISSANTSTASLQKPTLPLSSPSSNSFASTLSPLTSASSQALQNVMSQTNQQTSDVMKPSSSLILGPLPPPPPGPPMPPAQPLKLGTLPAPLPPSNSGTWFQANTLRKNAVCPPKPMKPLYWTRIVAPKPKIIEESTDYSSDTENSKIESPKQLWQVIEETNLDNITEFTDLFSRQPVVPKQKAEKLKPSRVKCLKILDSKRSQNVGIFYRSLHFDFEEIEHAVYHCDTSIVSLETLQHIKEFNATPSELELIKDASNGDIPLDAPEQFLFRMAQISSSSERISCIVFQAEFDEGSTQVSRKLDVVKQLCNFSIESEDLKLLFSIILTLGNYMNGGNRARGQADGFGLEILGKLKDVKSKDSKITLLHFIVKTYINTKRKNGTPLHDVMLPIPDPNDVEKAVAVDFEDIKQQIMELKKKLNDCRNITERVLLTNENIEPFKSKMESFTEMSRKRIEKQINKLEDCRKVFIKTMKFYHYIPKSGTLEQCTPAKFFDCWLNFTYDFKDIWKKEITILTNELLKKMQSHQKSVKPVSNKPNKLKPGSLKDRLQKLGKI